MIHFMTLNPAPYAAMQRGEKTVEMRLYDDKRRAVQTGDIIRFTCPGFTGESLNARVDAVRVFPDFAALYAAYDKRALGYAVGALADPRDMERYYSPARIARYGVVALEITLTDR